MFCPLTLRGHSRHHSTAPHRQQLSSSKLAASQGAREVANIQRMSCWAGGTAAAPNKQNRINRKTEGRERADERCGEEGGRRGDYFFFQMRTHRSAPAEANRSS